MSRFAILHEIEKLDPVTDRHRIVFLFCCYEIPVDTTRALEFALFRTFAAPSISALLDRTKDSSSVRRSATTIPTSSSMS